MRDLFSSIFNIFRFCGRFITGIRNLVFNLLFLLIVAVVVFSFIPKKIETYPQNSILRLSIEGKIVEEKKNPQPFSEFIENELYTDSPAQQTALQDILDVIASATTDKSIGTLFLDLRYMTGAGLNQLHAIGSSLENFKKSGKTVVAYQDYYSQAQYYLASYADTVGIGPLGAVDLHGFGVYRLYFHDAMEKLGVNYNIFKVGEYKSALEPFIRNDMSEADKFQNSQWLEALWSLFVDDIVANRKIPRQNLIDYTNNAPRELRRTEGDTAQLALQTGLVDQLWTKEQLDKHLKGLSGARGSSAKFIAFSEYLSRINTSYSQPTPGKPAIGLLVAEGNILPGKQPPGQIGGETLSTLIKRAREDKNIKALVLRINSGGGSALASEEIRQELTEVQKAGKPVIISMGAVAASGGYWIAANADEIWASKTTITGSIGIFGAVPTFEKTLEKLGIYNDGLGTTPLASGLDVSQPLAKDLQSVMQQSVANNYERFLDIVATGRKIPKEKVRNLAGGRVYDGIAAKEIGLVDKLGTLDQAITAAASLAKITDYTTEYITPPVSVRDQVLKIFSGEFEGLFGTISTGDNRWLSNIQRRLSHKLETLGMLQDPKGVYAHWMSEFTM